MKKVLALLLGTVLLLSLAPLSGAGARTRSSAYRGLDTGWWRHDGTKGRLHYISVYEVSRVDEADPAQFRAVYYSYPCSVGKRDRPEDCQWKGRTVKRVKVDIFEMDPLMDTARAVIHLGSKRSELNFTGRGDYHPFAFQYLSEFMFPPYFAHLSTGASGYVFRMAKAEGDLFGLGFTKKEQRGASMATSAHASVSSCLDIYCLP